MESRIVNGDKPNVYSPHTISKSDRKSNESPRVNRRRGEINKRLALLTKLLEVLKLIPTKVGGVKENYA